jgi:hypothetical protein
MEWKLKYQDVNCSQSPRVISVTSEAVVGYTVHLGRSLILSQGNTRDRSSKKMELSVVMDTNSSCE